MMLKVFKIFTVKQTTLTQSLFLLKNILSYDESFLHFKRTKY